MRMARGIGAAIGALLAFSNVASALNPSLDISQYAHAAWRVRDGLAKGTTWAVAQTPDGYLWLGTEFGVLRFDGVKSVPWQPPGGEGLPGSIILHLFVARDGTLWIGTHKGLASWKNGKLIRYSELDGQEVSSIIEDREGTIWISSWGSAAGRLCTIHGGRATCHGEDGSFGLGLYSLYEDSRGNIWAGGTTGVWRWKPGPPKFYPIPDRAREISVTSMTEGDDGAILIITPDGFFRLVNGRAAEYAPPGNTQHFTPNKCLRDRNGGIWIGTMGQGLVHIHHGRAAVYTKSDGLSGDYISALFEDREGNIWIGTTSGFDRFNGFAVPTISAKQGLSNTNVWSVLAARDGSVWLGTSEGVNRWEDGQITVYRSLSASGTAHLGPPGTVSEITDRGLPDSGVDSLYQDEDGRIWVSTLRGIAYFENGRFIPVTGLPREAVHSMVGDRAGSLWVAFDQFGLFHLLGGTVVERIPWAKLGHSGFALALLPDSIHGGLWLGFVGGRIAYFKDGQVRAQYTEADGLGHGTVRNLQLDKDGVLWAATEGGLSRLENGRITTLSSQNGLPCDTVHWMMADDAGSVWMHMNCGLVRIARNELGAWAAGPKRRIQARVFDGSDGVMIRATSSAFSPLVTKSKDGKLWFADADGAGVIDPGHMSFNGTPPPVHIEQVSADRKTFDASENLHLPPFIRDLEIDYTALSFIAAEKVFFRYKLEGIGDDWQDVHTRRQAFYTNLAPGKYRFRVIACNNDGVWNEAGASFDFSVAAAYYQTGWFRASCAAAFLALLWGLYRYRLHQISREFNVRLEERVSERTRMARDLHDTLLQSFHGLMLHFQVVNKLLPEGKAKAQLEKTMERADRAIAEGRSAVYDLRSPAIATNDLQEAVNAVGSELSSDNDGVFGLTVEGPPKELHPTIRDEIYRISREALSNAFKHANAGRIEAEITYGPQVLRLRIRDDGEGIPPEVLEQGRPGHFGLPGMRERARQIGAELTIWSGASTGTEIELSLAGSIAYCTSPQRPRLWLFRRKVR
jgi:signal transduction histidine kinase/ligand-binding sensor domain-containing protein